MSIIYEHGDELELWRSLTILGYCDNVASVPKAPFIIYSRISSFGHACPEINNVLIPRLKNCAMDMLTYYGNIFHIF